MLSLMLLGALGGAELTQYATANPLYTLCRRLIYRRVVISSADSGAKFIRSLRANPNLGPMVRSLSTLKCFLYNYQADLDHSH